MSEQIKDGGPAFPVVETVPRDIGNGAGDYITISDTYSSGGMTLRDFFAAKAMASMDYNHSSDDVLARDCYRFADAMLRAREAMS